ncbi:MAG: PEP-CTERM sorting domain-containing protein [Myxococcota bacterium]|nr:PEP-CTERM sorting domain-containing protein [Myxococcales bacterium]
MPDAAPFPSASSPARRGARFHPRRWRRVGRTISVATILAGPIAVALVLASSPATAISFTDFGANGTGGTLNGQGFTVGPDAEVFELEAILGHAGATNGARLSSEAVPAGLSITFSAMLSSDASDLTLTYAISNASAVAIDDVFFVSYLDAEIAEPINTFFNEYATTTGSLAPGQHFEVDEPGFAGVGDVYDNAVAGLLDDTNALANAAAADDVAMAIAWRLGQLPPGGIETIEIMISEDRDAIGGFAITQADAGPHASSTTLTFSGRRLITSQPIPEPGAALLFAAGLLVAGFRRARSDA